MHTSMQQEYFPDLAKKICPMPHIVAPSEAIKSKEAD